MSTKQLTAEAMALPIAEKVSLAQALWQSIDAGVPDSDERAAVREAVRRDKELSAGTVVGLSHEEAMKAARPVLDAIDEAVAVIVAAPERWRIIEEDVRRYLRACP